MVKFIEEQILTASFLASLISGFITSFLFLFSLLLLLRPWMRIGKSIATHNDDLDPTNRPCWAFKVVNYSLFSGYDVKVEVSEKIVSYGPNGSPNYRTIPLQLLRDQYPRVGPFRLRFRDSSDADFALWFITYIDLSRKLASPQSKVEIRITCRHALTGLGNVWTKEYTRSDIKAGTFKSGNNFDIV